MSIRSYAIALMVFAFACSGKKTETSAEAEFQKFSEKFHELSLPINFSEEKQLISQSDSLPLEIVKNYLDVFGIQRVYPTGSVSGSDYTALLCKIDYDELETAVVALFFDKSGAYQSRLTVFGFTDEVSGHFGYVQNTAWEGSVISRKIEYHFGNGGEDPSQYAEVKTTINPDATLTNDPDLIAPEVIPVSDEPAYAAEIFEYRSETLKNYQLYAIYPHQDAPQFLVVRNDEARLLTLNEEGETEEGQALDDEEFVSAKFLQELETEGIVTFGQIELTTRADLNVVFNHSQTKRSLIIGPSYGYSGETGSGKLALHQAVDGYRFFVNLTTDGHICELQGSIRVKGNIGYFQGEPFGTTCKLVFLFSSDSVEILSVTSNSACGCGANASLNHQFTAK